MRRFTRMRQGSHLRRAAVCQATALSIALLPAIMCRGADLRASLPGAVGNFKLTHPAVLYTPTNLDSHLDGEAEAMKHYGFRQCAYGEYAPGGRGSQLITVDIFSFANPADAFGYYSMQRNPAAPRVAVGAEGYSEPTALNFWRGSSYVRLAITVSPVPASFQQEMRRLAAAVGSKLSGTTSPPAMLSLLPPGKQARSEQYQPTNIAAQSYLVNGVLAKYPTAGPQSMLFVCAYPSPAAARRAYQQYSLYLARPLILAAGARAAPVKGVGDAAVSEKTRFSGQVVAALKGKYVVGIIRAKNPAAAQNLVRAAVARAH
ncbi:MAG TPA: DUF6599 family protein [Chthonomonadales bacterium]|nr:DUF6599 family protein [Chthonomonadales bacterium]